MKRIIAIILIIAFTSSICYAGWVDDWLQQKTVSSPDYLQGQKRGYFTAGSFSARWYQGQDYLFSIAKPKFKAGCGGIDAFLGGFSFLNFDYLVQKLQRMLQSAPAIAFDIALQTLCEQCANSLKGFENIIDKLNNLQLDDCKASKALVATIADPLTGNHLPAEYQSALADFWQSSGIKDLWSDVSKVTKSNNDLPTGDLSGMFAGCPADVKALFANTGSVLDHIGSRFSVTQSYIDLMRGFVGDVVLQNNGSNAYYATYTPPCDYNKDKDVDNFLEGNVQAKSSAGTCYQITDTNRNLVQWVSGMMATISTKMKTRVALTSQEEGFVKTIPLPLKLIMKYSIQTRQESVMSGLMSDVVARAYAFAMMSDLYYKASAVMEKAYSLSTYQKSAADTQPEYSCKINLTGAPEKIEDFYKELHRRHVALKNAYTAYAAEINAVQGLVARMESFNDEAYRILSDKFSPSLAKRAIGG